MIIKILGTGCPSCKQLYKMTEEAIGKLKIKCELEYITDIHKIVSLGIMQTPALMINDKVVASGYIPKTQELREIITKHLDK